MRRAWIVPLALASAASAAIADLDVRVGNGDRITSALASGEFERFRVVCPAGATLSVKAKAAKTGPSLNVFVLDAADQPVGSQAGTSVALSGIALAKTGEYVVEVAAQDLVSAGGYTISIAWKTPLKFAQTLSLGPAASGEMNFTADAGGTAAVSVKAAAGSQAAASLESLTDPDGGIAALAGVSAKSPLPVTGEYLLRATAGPPGGDVTATVKVKPPKVAKRKLVFAEGAVPPRTQILAVATFGAAGGTLSAPDDGPIAGASLTVPAGAAGGSTAFLIGTGPDVDLPAFPAASAAGPAVFVGPEGVAAKTGKTFSVTIPYDPSAFPDGTSFLHVYTRDASGAVTEILAGVTVDEVRHTVTFPVSHFSVFMAARSGVRTNLVARLSPPGLHDHDFFGGSVSLAGSFLLAAAPQFDAPGGGKLAGAVFSYEDTGGAYVLRQTIQPADVGDGDGFGFDARASGTTLAVGANGRRGADGFSAGAGSVFVYDLSGATWMQTAEIQPDDGQALDFFGRGLALDADTIVAGAVGDDDAGNGFGAAYVYARSGTAWVKEAKLLGATANSQFGLSVAVSGDTALVGAFRDASGPLAAGSAYVYTRNGGTWSQDARIDATAAGGKLGRAVALSGAYAICGQPGAGGGAGSVVVFENTDGAWMFLQEIQGDGTANERFGQAVAFDGTTLVVGAPSTAGPGRAYVYRLNVGTFQLVAGVNLGATAFTEFGAAVAVDAGTVVVGHPSEDVPGPKGTTVPAGGSAAVLRVP